MGGENQSDSQQESHIQQQQPSQRQSLLEKRKTMIYLPGNLKQQYKVLSQIRPDSPKTQEACKQLGIDQKIFELKQPEEFGGPQVTEEIKKLRYEHYLQRLQQSAIDILQKRKDLAQYQRQRHREEQQNQEYNTDCIPHNLKRKFNSLTQLNQSQVANMYNIFTKTQAYFRNSHNNPHTKQLQDLVNQDNHSVSDQSIQNHKIDQKMDMEISRYNRTKNQQLRRAQLQLDEDKKRVDLINKQRNKDQKVVEVILTQKMKQIELQNQQKKELEDKLKSVKLASESYKIKKMEQNKKIAAKLEQVREHLREEAEKKQRELEEKYEREVQKKQRNDRNRQQLRTQQAKYRDDTYKTIIEKCFQQTISDQNHKKQLQDKQKSIRETLDKVIQEHQEAHYQILEQKEKYSINKTGNKLSKEEENIKNLDLICEQIMKNLEKKEDEQEEYKRHRQTLKQLKKEEIDCREFREQLDRIQKAKMQQVEQHKEEMKKSQDYKQELRRLKQEDIQENYKRQKKMKDYQMQQLIEKDRLLKEKKLIHQLEQNIVQQTAVDKFYQEALEKDRVQQCVEQLSNTIHLHKLPWINENLTEIEKQRNLKLAKQIMNEEQFKKQFPMFQKISKPKGQQ